MSFLVPWVGGRCGCPDCRGESIPFSRNEWTRRKNKNGNPYGSYKNPKAKHHSRHRRTGLDFGL